MKPRWPTYGMEFVDCHSLPTGISVPTLDFGLCTGLTITAAGDLQLT